MLDELAEVVLRSFAVSGSATLLASAWSIPAVAALLSSESRLSKAVIHLAGALTGMPTVVLGLLLYMLLASSGPLGRLGILYSPTAIVLGQAILVTPYIIYLGYSFLLERRKDILELALSLGATRMQAVSTVVLEGLQGLISVVVVAFNRALGELGIALMLGGNIKGLTRVMTTAIALEISRGGYELALALGGILLAITLAVSVAIRIVGERL